MKIAVAIVLALASLQSALAEDTVVMGELLKNEPMQYVPAECPENYVCLSWWWRSVIAIQKTVRGPTLSGHVAAAAMQHTSLEPLFKKNARLFVLRPIADPVERARLRVDYYLESMTEAHQM